MTDLSPAALAIWEAFNSEEPGVFVDYGDCLAAALRAAVDQVVPEQALKDVPGRFVNGCCHARLQGTRADLLAIAAELEQS